MTNSFEVVGPGTCNPKRFPSPLIEHTSSTGDLTIYSSVDESVILRLEEVDIPTAHKINEAIRLAEKKALRKARTDAALELLQIAENFTK